MEFCPKCNGRTSTYRHPSAKIWCTKCGFVVREENGPMWWEKKIEQLRTENEDLKHKINTRYWDRVRNENVRLRAECAQFQEEGKLGKELARHIFDLPTIELDAEAFVVAHKVLGSKTP